MAIYVGGLRAMRRTSELSESAELLSSELIFFFGSASYVNSAGQLSTESAELLSCWPTQYRARFARAARCITT